MNRKLNCQLQVSCLTSLRPTIPIRQESKRHAKYKVWFDALTQSILASISSHSPPNLVYKFPWTDPRTKRSHFDPSMPKSNDQDPYKQSLKLMRRQGCANRKWAEKKNRTFGSHRGREERRSTRDAVRAGGFNCISSFIFLFFISLYFSFLRVDREYMSRI